MHRGFADDYPKLYAAAAGFQAGTFAVLVMLAGLGLASAWYRRTFWYVANLMASTFHGDEAVRAGFSWQTLSGIALYVILYSLFGALFGVVMGDRFPRLRLALLGILCAIGWYYLWYWLLWPRLNPLIAIYTHDRPALWGHMVYGALLARYPVYLDRLRRVPPAPPAQPVLTDANDSPV